MTPEIKQRIEQIRRGEVPEGYVKKRKVVIPQQWGLPQIKDIASISSGSTPNRNNSEYWNGNIAWVTTGELSSGHVNHTSELITVKAVKETKMRIYPQGTLLMAMYGQGKTRGTVAILEIDAAVNQACAAITVKDGKSKFLFYQLKNSYQDIRKLSNTGNQENLNADIIKTYQVPWAPDEEQERISTILTTQGKVIELKEKRLAEKQRQKKYLMQQLLTGKKRLPGFSGQWEIKDFNQVFAFGVTNTFSRECMCEDSTGVKNIHYGDILVRYGEVLKLSEQEIPSLLSDIGAKITTFVEDGDVVIADTAEDLTAGKAVEVQETHGKKVAAGLHTMLCKPIKDCFAPGWLGYYMNSETYHKQLVPYIAGVKVMSISKGNIVKTHILMPPIEEQAAIAEVLSTADHEIDLLRQDIEQEKQKKKALMQLLLTGIVRVKT